MNVVEDIKQQIVDLNGKLTAIQTECSHPSAGLTKKHGASTGNYDPSNNAFWTDFHCGLCDKRWTEDGSK